MKKTLLLNLFLLISLSLMGQDEELYNHYVYNPMLLNPGATAMDEGYNIFLNYRTHWSSFDEAPKRYTAGFEGDVYGNLGVGALLGLHEVGAVQRLNFDLFYRYKIRTESLDLGVGLGTGIETFSLNNDILTDPFHEPNDPVLAEALDGAEYFNIHFGIHGIYADRFLFGLSAPQMVRSRLDSEDDPVNDDKEFFSSSVLMVGYIWDLKEYDLSVKPMVTYKDLPDYPSHLDIAVLASFYDDKLLGGLRYTVGAGDGIGFYLGTRFSSVNLLYSYDSSFAPLQDYSNGSHEITVGFRWGKSE